MLRKQGTKVDPVYLVVVDQPTLPSREVTMGVVQAFVMSGDLGSPTPKTRILSMCYQEPWREDDDPAFMCAVLNRLLKDCPDLSDAVEEGVTKGFGDASISYSTINGLAATGERFRCVEILPR